MLVNPYYDYWTDEDLMTLGDAICEEFGKGKDFRTIGGYLVDLYMPVGAVIYAMSKATAYLCPAYVEQIPARFRELN
jgi:hypothetical protein